MGSGKVNFKTDQKIPVTLVITRGTHLEHFFMNWVEPDPKNITKKIINWLISQSWYSVSNIQGIWTHGVTIAGLGIIRCKLLTEQLDSVLVSLTDEAPNTDKINKVLLNKFDDGLARLNQFKENDIIPFSIRDKIPECNLWISNYDISLDESIRQLKNQQIQGCLPEGLRLAQIIAKNIVNSDIVY
ncbi:MAG: endonuclease dU [Candidatus Hodarchaeales archaeon]